MLLHNCDAQMPTPGNARLKMNSTLADGWGYLLSHPTLDLVEIHAANGGEMVKPFLDQPSLQSTTWLSQEQKH